MSKSEVKLNDYYTPCGNCGKKDKLRFFRWKYLKSFLKFLYENIKSGFKQVSYDEYNNRLSICRACIFFDPEQTRCTDCGCYVKVKSKFKTENCPQGYWRKLK